MTKSWKMETPTAAVLLPAVGDRAWVHVGALEAPLQGDAEDAEQEQGDDGGQPPLVVVEVLGRAERGPGEHDAEQEQHDDGADVDQDLGDGDELGRQQDVEAGRAGQHDDQVQGGVHQVLGGDHPEGGQRPWPGPDARRRSAGPR